LHAIESARFDQVSWLPVPLRFTCGMAAVQYGFPGFKDALNEGGIDLAQYTSIPAPAAGCWV
jgi:hypothetical protein